MGWRDDAIPVTTTSGDWRSQAIPLPSPSSAPKAPHYWPAGAKARSEAAADAVREQSNIDDESNMSMSDRAAHALMGATESIPGSSLADEVAGAVNTLPDWVKPLLATPAASAVAVPAVIGMLVDKARGTGFYEKGRDAQREATVEADADPLADLGRGLGAVAQIAIPSRAVTGGGTAVAKILQGAGAGGVAGGLQGFGAGNGAGDSLEQAAIQGGVGAAGGAALGALGAAKGSAIDVNISDPARRAAAALVEAAGKAAPTAGRVIGAVKGAAVGPVGAGAGFYGGGKVGDKVASIAKVLAPLIRPTIDVTPDMVAGVEPGAIPYDILDEFGIRPEEAIKATPPGSPSDETPDPISSPQADAYTQSLRNQALDSLVNEPTAKGGTVWHLTADDIRAGKTPPPEFQQRLDAAKAEAAAKDFSSDFEEPAMPATPPEATRAGGGGGEYRPEGAGVAPDPSELRGAALEELASPKPERAPWEDQAVEAFKNAAGNPDQYRAVSEWLTQNGVDLGTQARLGEEAGTIDSSLELPMRRPRSIDASAPTGPLGADELKAEVAAAVQRGEPLKALADRLGVNQGDIAAFYKGAQLGFLDPLVEPAPGGEPVESGGAEPGARGGRNATRRLPSSFALEVPPPPHPVAEQLKLFKAGKRSPRGAEQAVLQYLDELHGDSLGNRSIEPKSYRVVRDDSPGLEGDLAKIDSAGNITVSERIHNGFTNFAGGGGDPESALGHYTVTHEWAHAHSPVLESAYDGPGQAIEEGTNDAVAKSFHRQRFGGEPAVGQDYVNLKHIVQKTLEHAGTPESGELIEEKLNQAARRFRQSEPLATPSDVVDAFVESFPADPSLRLALRDAILKRWPL